jgi:hypothetical protein
LLDHLRYLSGHLSQACRDLPGLRQRLDRL